MPHQNHSTPSSHPTPSNAFDRLFLGRLDERDEPITSLEADTAGPWSVEPVPGHGYGLLRTGERLARGFRPSITFPSRWLALLAAAVLPGTGREPLLSILGEADPGGEGFPLRLEDGTVVGYLEPFDEGLVDAMNVAIGLVRSPLALASLLEAAGAVALERCGAILEERMGAAEAGAGAGPGLSPAAGRATDLAGAS